MRGRGVFKFLAIVWSIGGGFLALQWLFVHFTDFSLNHVASAEIGLAKQSAAGTAHCREVLQGTNAAAPAAASNYRAWSLGFQFGFADEMANGAIQDPNRVAQTLANAQALARGLAVPEVRLPAGHTAYAMRDFVVALEEDPQCVSAALTARYSPRHASLYKFGAAVGMAAVYRMAIPEGAALETEIRAYGRAAEIPAELWQPLLEKHLPAPAEGMNRAAALQTFVQRIDGYVKTLD